MKKIQNFLVLQEIRRALCGLEEKQKFFKKKMAYIS